MRKSKLIERREFINNAINEPDVAANLISGQLGKFRRSNGITKRVEILADIMHLSERTIWRDLENY